MLLHESILDRLKSQHLAISKIIKDVDIDLLNKSPEPGKWSIRENLAHITGYHHVFLERLNKILNDENPYFERYTADTDTEFKKWHSFNSRELLKHLDENRQAMNTFLYNLTPEQLNRKGTHQKFGSMNVIQWIEFFLLHEAHHIYTIFKITRQFNT